MKLLIIIFFSLISITCTSYETIRLQDRLYLNDLIGKDDSRKIKSSHTLSPGEQKKWVRYYKKKFTAKSSNSGIYVQLNNKAADLISQGNYSEARLLLLQAIKENPEFAAAYNNIAVASEASGNNDDAFQNYSKACLIEPDNKYYRRNFNSLK